MRNPAVLWLMVATVLCAADGGSVPVPVPPVLIEYEYLAEHLRQPIEGHPHYSLIEALVYSRQPLDLCLALSGRSVKDQPTHYCNNRERVQRLQARGRFASLAVVDAQRTPGGPDLPSGYAFAFRERSGAAVRWRFLPASEPSKRGGGLTPLASVPGLKLHQRRIGTTAGNGTAVEIGGQLIEAQPWPEISAPPYFVAYRGTLSVDVHIVTLPLGTQEWSVVSTPGEIKPGSRWVLRDPQGQEHAVEVASTDGQRLILRGGGAQWDLGLAERAGLAGELRVRSEDHTATLVIASDGSFQILADREKLATGTVERTPIGDGLRWRFRSPEWARPKSMESIVTTSDGRVKVSTGNPLPRQP